MTIVLLLCLLVKPILVDRVLPPWVDPHSIIVNPMEGIGIKTAVEEEMMSHILSEMTIPVDRVHLIIENPSEGMGTLTAVEAEMTIPEEVIIWHLYQTLRYRVLPPWVDPRSIIENPSEGMGT